MNEQPNPYSISLDNVGTPVRNILVVDDDKDINYLIQTRLKARGYDVRQAFDGETALQAIRKAAPDLVLLDVSMPGMDGLEVLRQIREQGWDIAVIMTTAFGSEEIAIEALRRGADDYLRKPFTTQNFRTVLERTIQKLELARQNTVLRQLLDEKHRQLEQELTRAAEIQADLLPNTLPHLPGFELVASCLPAREVGGDFYDWFCSDSGIFNFILGDVMGKGMPAALLMATVRAAIRAVAAEHSPQESIYHVDSALRNDLERSNSYVTLFLGQIDPETRRLSFIDAGHGHCCIRRADGRTEGLEPRGLPLGIFVKEAQIAYETGQVTLEPGDTLILYSDGLAMTSGELFSPADLAAQIASADNTQAMLDQLIALVPAYAEQDDDLTILVLHCSEG